MSNDVYTADKDYGVKGVPNVLLVDTNGVIVFMGHSSASNIEQDIDTFNKGENLICEGCSPKTEEAGAEAEARKCTLENLEKLKKDTAEWIMDPIIQV